MAFLGMHGVLTPAQKSSLKPAIYPGCLPRIHLQFSGFGVIDVITRAIAGKEMCTYDDFYHRFR